MRSIASLAAGAIVALVSVGAQAQNLPPPPPAGPAPAPASPNCSVQSEQARGGQCVACQAFHGDPAKCDRELPPQGYHKRCRNTGASVWTEVWCRGAAGPPPEKKDSGCGACAIGSSGEEQPLTLWLSLGLLTLVGARRLTPSSQGRAVQR